MNSDTFESDLQSLLDRDYSIAIEIHSQAEQEYEQIISSLDDIQEMAQLVGDNFRVSADDARILGNVFPGILQEATTMADGTIQLNKQMAQSAMDAAQTEVVANAEAAKEKLLTSAQELRAKQSRYQAMADAALKLAKGEIEGEDAKAEAIGIIENGLAELTAEAENVERENSEETTNLSSENAGIMAQN